MGNISTTTIIIGNIITLAGSALMVLVGFLKSKKSILITQAVQVSVMAFGNYVLGGISGVIVNAVTLIRNLVALKTKFSVPIKIAFIAVQIVLAVIFRQDGIIYWLPIVAGCMFTWFIDTEDMFLFKWIIIIVQALWAVFDFSIYNYSTLVFDIFAIISNTVAVYQMKKTKDAEQ